MSNLDVGPAYGRDYKSSDDVKKDWHDNKDFKIIDGPYINKSDFEKYKEQYNHSGVVIWYNQFTTYVIIKG